MLDVGRRCNARCAFCYYSQSQRTDDPSSKLLKGRVDLAVRYGKRAVDLSGGEPTLRDDLPQLIRHCRTAGLERTTVITNGLRTACFDYCKELRDAGLTDALVSVHGGRADLHDSLTGVRGSFSKLRNTIRHLHQLGLGVRSNSVVNGANLDHLDELLEFLADEGIRVVNLLVFNPSQAAAQLAAEHPLQIRDYRVTGAALSKALDRLDDRFEAINIRFLPFCVVPDHLGSVRTQWQKLYEHHEWDPVLYVAYRLGWPAAVAAILAGALLPRRMVPRHRCADIPTRLGRLLSSTRMTMFYRHGPPCRPCSLRRICPGVPRSHVRHFGFPALDPIELRTRITDPLAFVGNGFDLGQRSQLV